MELLGERPVWSMSGSELLTTHDAVDAEIARLESYQLKLVAAIETTGSSSAPTPNPWTSAAAND